MGNADTKLNFRKAVVQLTSKTQVSIVKTICFVCSKILLVCVKETRSLIKINVTTKTGY